MPFVVTRANVPISREQEVALKERLGRAIAHVPGKSEAGPQGVQVGTAMGKNVITQFSDPMMGLS